MIYLEDGTVKPVEKSELPVKLPDKVNFEVDGNPLDKDPNWKHTTIKKQVKKL